MRPVSGGGVGTTVGEGMAVGEAGTVVGVVVAIGAGAPSSFCLIGVLVKIVIVGVVVTATIPVGSLAGVVDEGGVDVGVSYTAKINVGVGEGIPPPAELQAVKIMIAKHK